MKEAITPSLTFIIFTYNSSDIIRRNLAHIKIAIEYEPIEHEIILVDNNSTDNTVEIVKKFDLESNLNIKIVENSRQGLSYSRMEGVKNSTKEFVCFIDDDNFIDKAWVKTLKNIIEEYNPDVIGGRTIGIADIPFPSWWKKNQGTYACGTRFQTTGFLANPLDKMWGAGLTARTKYLKPTLLKLDLLSTGRIGNKQMSGEDAELNYRMRLLGAKFYHSKDLVLEHYMRSDRLTKAHIRKTREGDALSGINYDIYWSLLTNKKRYKLFNLAVLILLGALPLSFKYKANYFKVALIRFTTLKKRLVIQKKIQDLFGPID